MILLFKMLWDMFKRVYVTFLEWYPIIYAWVSTEIRRLTTILKFAQRFVSFISFANRLIMIPVHDFANCRENYWVPGHFIWNFTLDWAHVIRILLLTHRGRPEFRDPFLWLWLCLVSSSHPYLKEILVRHASGEHMKEWNCENKG